MDLQTGVRGARLLDEPAEHEGVIRLSRGLRLPQPLFRSLRQWSYAASQAARP